MTELEQMNAESKPASLATGNRLHKPTRGIVLAELTVNAPAGERRVALEKRQRVAEMSPEGMQRLLLTSEVAGLPNRRAFNEAGLASAVAMCDVDGLHALNGCGGYEAGDAVLKAKADALREAGLDAYHDKGDEFLCRGSNIEDLVTKLERARAMLRERKILVAQADGSTLCITGVDFSYGVGKDIDEAELALRNHKAERESRRELERGKLRGIRVDRRKVTVRNAAQQQCQKSAQSLPPTNYSRLPRRERLHRKKSHK
jgi:GGDEF domain-containing protein